MALTISQDQRSIPLTFRLRALFGGALGQAGWLLLGIGLIFFRLFIVHSEALTFWKFLGPMTTANGVITNVQGTIFSETYYDRFDRIPIYAIAYTFHTPDGRTVHGASYRTGNGAILPDPVIVKYRTDHPQYSCIEGMRSAPYLAESGIFILFPLMGLVCLYASLFDGRRFLGRLAHYRAVPGTLIQVEALKPVEGERQEDTKCRVTFEFANPEGGRSEAQFDFGVLPTAWWVFADDPTKMKPTEMLLVDPEHLTKAILPIQHKLQPNGPSRLIDDAPELGVAALIIPLITVIGYGWYLLELVVM